MKELQMLLITFGTVVGLMSLVMLFVINSNIIQNYKETKRIFKDFCKSHYLYKGHIGNQIWFSRNDEVGESYQYNEIIFFGDGSIKLRENYYIHTGFLTFTFVHRYYYRKFHRVKEQYIHQHQMSERFRNVGNVLVRNHPTKSRDINSFKFFRG